MDKSFYGVHANAGVDFEVRWGEVHALLGENGAGKSTLCSLAAGLYKPDAGEILVDGEPATFRSPADALAAEGEASTYVGMMRHNAKTLHDALAEPDHDDHDEHGDDDDDHGHSH